MTQESANILVVEDEAGMRKTLSGILGDLVDEIKVFSASEKFPSDMTVLLLRRQD